MPNILRIILFPVSVLYAIVLKVRHFLYDVSIFSTYKSNIPSVGIGNLAFGGSGKSPFTIYLAQFLTNHQLKVAIVSRGYKRSTSGVIHCNANHTAAEIGDEPKMYLSKLTQVTVIVSEKRKDAMVYLESISEPPDVILLDDCYQHRAVSPTVLLLLSESHNPYWKDYLVPSGYLRDVKSAAKRASALVITKCESTTNLELPKMWTDRPAFYSVINYQPAVQKGTNALVLDSVVCFSALADDSKFLEYIRSNYDLVKAHSFSDHHYFTINELEDIISSAGDNASILTTEKDYARLTNEQIKLLSNTKFHIIPISTPAIESEKFQEYILNSLGLDL